MPPNRSRATAKDGRRRPKSLSLDEYYAKIYGERWPSLRAAMVEEPRKIALWNRFCQVPFAEAMDGLVRVNKYSLTQAFDLNRASGANGASKDESARRIAKPAVDAFNIRAYYLMDYASAYVVEQLQVSAFDRVLDMCAAPGGKSIAISQFLSPDGNLTSNESRGDRCARLRRNLLEHVPVNYVPWRVTQRDAQTWYDPGAYTRVLVDAPCSSERHLLHQASGAPVQLAEWSEESTSKLALVQRGLLQRALESVEVGGRVVYSTCSLSPLENDGVVREALWCTRCAVKVVPPSAGPAAGADPDVQEGGVVCASSSSAPLPQGEAAGAGGSALGEETEFGRLILPDQCHGWGPMFYCILEKTGNVRSMSSDDEEEDSDASEEEDGE